MRNIVARWLLASLLIALVGGCAGQPPAQAPVVDATAITAALDSLNKAFVAAVAARDTDAVVSLYSDDAQLLPAGMPRASGRDAIRAAWAGFLATPGLELNATSSTPIITEAGDMVIDIGSYQMTMNDPKGRPIVDVGKYVTVVKRVDGGWKIVVDTFNSDLAPPGM